MTSSGQFSSRRLFVSELEARLDAILFASPSYRSATEISAELELLTRVQQEQMLSWIATAAQTDAEVGYMVLNIAPRAFKNLGTEEIDAWVLAGLNAYDHGGAAAAKNRLHDLESFIDKRDRKSPVRFADVEARLSRFLQGLSGRPLGLAISNRAAAWTDSETIYLPAQLDVSNDAVSGREKYQVLVAMLWAQARYGTFGSVSTDLAAALQPWMDTADQSRALDWLAILEAVRLEARIAADLPGLGRCIAEMRGPWPPALISLLERLFRPEAMLSDSLAVLAECLADGLEAPQLPHACELDPATALRLRSQRMQRDQATLHRAISALKGSSGRSGQREGDMVLLQASVGDVAPISMDEAASLLKEAQAAALSLQQDLGELPSELMVPAGTGAWQPKSGDAADVALGGLQDSERRYDEWDYRRKAYRRGWCHLHESDVQSGAEAYVDNVRQRYANLIRQLRRRFELLSGEERMLGRQPDGEDIDVDAMVDALADRRSGAEPSPRLFRRRIRNQRSLAAMFMVDMSGSTKGWVNDAEREALVMLCESLESLGDAYAIYGFSGWTRTRCDMYRVKHFSERYDQTVRARIAGIEAKDYTRMGVAIRHLTQLLLQQPARHRLLVTLSDGRPDDYGDEYRGYYGIEDTRRALQEAHGQGIRSYCITIDRHGADYLGHMYGSARYTVIDDVKKLPLKVADIYRRLIS